MSSSAPANEQWTTLQAFRHPRVITMAFLGFSAGMPLLLIFGTLSLWLREADVSRSAVTYFSWAALGYSFKFVWAPIVDRLPLPALSQYLGQRRSWLLISQLSITLAISWMAFTDPALQLHSMAYAAVLLGFSGATQDIVIDAYRIESADQRMQAMMAAGYTAGYRIGMLISGAGALKLASWLGTSSGHYVLEAWRWTYLTMAALMAVGIITTLIIREPAVQRPENRYLRGLEDYLRFLGLFALSISCFIAIFIYLGLVLETARLTLTTYAPHSSGLVNFVAETLRLVCSLLVALLVTRLSIRLGMCRQAHLQETYIDPILDFFRRYGRSAILILALVGLYRISDIVLGVIANVFYLDMGFSKDQIADITKTFGLVMIIFGSFLGGSLTLRFGVMPILFIGALLSAATNLLFVVLANSPPDSWLLVGVITADNLSSGLASAAFIAYLSSLTSISFTAFQYALFSSLMTLLPKLFGGYSGSIVESIGYPHFFLLTALIGLPVLLLIWLASRWIPPVNQRGSIAHE